MGQIMKLYTTLFLMLIMAVSAMGIVTAQVRLIQVQNLHKSIVAEVKGSNCDRTVIESCFDRAKNTECSLIITFYEKKGKIEKCADAQRLPEKIAGVEIVKIEVEMPVRFPVFEIYRKEKIVGYVMMEI